MSPVHRAIPRVLTVSNGLKLYSNQILRGKIKSFKGSVGYRKDTKKAIITLAEGNTIDSSLEIK